VDDFGLVYFKARWLDVALGRFAQADTLIPGAGDSQAWDRYAFALNNPVRYSDPSGHSAECGIYAGTSCGGVGPQQPTLLRDQMGISVSQHLNIPQEDVINGANNAWEFTTAVYSFIFEPIDWIVSGAYCVQGDCSPWIMAGLLPYIPASTGRYGDDVVSILYHSANPDNVSDIITHGFKTNKPDVYSAWHNNRFGRGVYLADTPVTALAERPGGQLLSVHVDLGKNLNVTHLGVVDYDVGQGIARGAREHGFDSITYLSAKVPGGINTVILNPGSIVSLSPTLWNDSVWNLFK